MRTLLLAMLLAACSGAPDTPAPTKVERMKVTVRKDKPPRICVTMFEDNVMHEEC